MGPTYDGADVGGAATPAAGGSGCSWARSLGEAHDSAAGGVCDVGSAGNGAAQPIVAWLQNQGVQLGQAACTHAPSVRAAGLGLILAQLKRFVQPALQMQPAQHCCWLARSTWDQEVAPCANASRKVHWPGQRSVQGVHLVNRAGNGPDRLAPCR